MFDYFGKQLPRRESYYWFLAIGIVLSWALAYLVIFLALLPFAENPDEAPRAFYVAAMIGGLLGPGALLWRRLNRQRRLDADHRD